jgi:CDGSH-type Zn-finger protein
MLNICETELKTKLEKEMARLVKHERNRPYLIQESDVKKFPIAICACGLSKNKPFCDGSHRRTDDEGEGKIYIYDEQNRVEVRVEY